MKRYKLNLPVSKITPNTYLLSINVIQIKNITMLNLPPNPKWDITQINQNTLINADCFDVFPFIEDKSIDMILADLPYGTTACKWDSILPLDKLWEQYERIIKPKGAVVLFGSEPFSSKLRFSNLKNFKYDWIWHKSKPSGISLSKTQPMRNHEVISVFYGGKYYPIKEDREGFTIGSINRLKNPGTIKYKNYTSEHNGLNETDFSNVSKLRMPTSIKKFASVPNVLGTLHPTQKPVELMEYLIKTYTNENEIVLDNTMGSGTTNLACLKLNRKSIGIEKEKQYYDIAVRRLSSYCG